MGSLQLNVYDDRSILLSDIEVNIPGIHISARHLDYPSNKESPVIFEIEGAIEHIREITILGVSHAVEKIQKTHFPRNTWALHLNNSSK